jgi:hypothetical protein
MTMASPFVALREPLPTAGAVLPEPRAYVRLLTSRGQPIPARVVERNGSTLMLASVVPIPLLSPEELDGLTLEFAERSRQVRMTGRFAQVSTKNPEMIELVDPELCESTLDKRFHTRVAAVRTALIYPQGVSTPIRTRTVDVSGGGFFVRGAELLRVGDEVAFEIWLEELSPPFSGTARVVRVDPAGGRGMVYEQVTSDQWARVADFVTSQLSSPLAAVEG